MKSVVFCSGSFDMLHAGHVLFLENCKKLGDILVVGVGTDAAVRSNKGSDRPIVSEVAREKLVGSLKVVNHCFLNENDLELESYLESVFSKLHPDIYAVNSDAVSIELREWTAARHGVKFKVMNRDAPVGCAGISSTGIIERVKGMDEKTREDR